jgi:hypothetical protein
MILSDEVFMGFVMIFFFIPHKSERFFLVSCVLKGKKNGETRIKITNDWFCPEIKREKKRFYNVSTVLLHNDNEILSDLSAKCLHLWDD